MKVAAVKIPDTAVANADMGLGLKQCQRKCLRNCSCMAYASAFSESNGGTGCLTWHGDLLDINTYRDAGQDLFIRVDAVVLGRYHLYLQQVYLFCRPYRTLTFNSFSLLEIISQSRKWLGHD